MKSNLTKLSLALLSAVFILGCQDLGTGAVEADQGIIQGEAYSTMRKRATLCPTVQVWADVQEK